MSSRFFTKNGRKPRIVKWAVNFERMWWCRTNRIAYSPNRAVVVTAIADRLGNLTIFSYRKRVDWIGQPQPGCTQSIGSLRGRYKTSHVG